MSSKENGEVKLSENSEDKEKPKSEENLSKERIPTILRDPSLEPVVALLKELIREHAHTSPIGVSHIADVETVGEKSPPEPSLWQKCAAEAFGTGLIVIFGVGVVNTVVFTGAQSGIWQVAVIWGLGIMLAIVMTASISGAHLNPAVSLAFALRRHSDFGLNLLFPYWISQFSGAFLAAFLNYFIFRKPIDAFEEKNFINRGSPESVLSAQCFGEYFPNPGFHYSGVSVDVDDEVELQIGTLGWDEWTVSAWNSLFIEAFGTFMLVCVIFSVTDERNTTVKNKDFAPFIIGMTVAVLISLYAPLQQAGFNPARDFGPRLAALCLGWGNVAIPGPQKGFLVYIIGPLLGGPIGGFFYDLVLRPPAHVKTT